MGHNSTIEDVQNDQIISLTRVVEHYTSVTHDFKKAYRQLEQQVSILRKELEKKNFSN